MTIVAERPPALAIPLGNGDGGLVARRAVVRWAWRLFKREWCQQTLILALVVVAVAATFVGAAVATTAPTPVNAGFGSAHDLAVFQSKGSQLTGQIAKIQKQFGTTDVIENETQQIPGSINTFDLRAQNPHGSFGTPMLSLTSGSFPTDGAQVAITSGLASIFNLAVGSTWNFAGTSRKVVGTVENPQSLLDEFALVVPGQISDPSQVTVLFNAGDFNVESLGSNFQVVGQNPDSSNILSPGTIVLALATIGMLLIALVAIGGFTVLAQRRLRSIGMLGSLGATDKNIRLVVKANGLVVGVVGTVLGAALGLVVWLAYRPHLDRDHHLNGPRSCRHILRCVATRTGNCESPDRHGSFRKAGSTEAGATLSRTGDHRSCWRVLSPRRFGGKP
jgi:putative ABC transport system permease protein